MRLFGVMAAVGLVAPLTGATLAAQDTLHVLYHTSGDTVAPSSIVTVMFDRPVAGALDSTVSAARVFHIEPNVAGSIIWRDPVTIRFIPSAPLMPDTRYTVTIDSALRAEGGSRLGKPYSFSFRVAGARLMARSYDKFTGRADTLAPDGRVSLLYSAPVDIERLRRGARIELSHCPAPADSVVPYRVLRQRPLARDDPSSLQYAGGYPRDSISDRFRTVVELEPASTLPLECAGRIVLPTMSDDSSYGREERYGARTAAVFRLLSLDCVSWPPRRCNRGVLWLQFASPVRRVEVLRAVRLDGHPVTLDVQGDRERTWPIRVHLVPRTTYTVRVDSSIHDEYGRRLEGPLEISAHIDDYAPTIIYPTGIITVPRSGSRTMPIRSINVRSVRLIAYRVPDSLRVRTMSMASGSAEPSPFVRGLRAETTLVALPDRLNADTTVEIPFPKMALAADHPLVLMRADIEQPASEAYAPTLSIARHAMVLAWPDRAGPMWLPYTLLQLTNLAVTAKLVGVQDGEALVTDLGDGHPRAGVTVTQVDRWGRAVARGVSDRAGIARLARMAPDSVPPPRTPLTPTPDLRFTTLQAESRDDHVVVSLGGRAIGYETASPLSVNSLGGRFDEQPLVAGAIFADRGILRPGEVVHVKGIVRRGLLGALQLPARSDSARITIRKEQDSWADDTTLMARDTVMRLSTFGTVVDSLRLRPGLPLARYVVDLQVVVGGHWRTIRSTGFRLAEYRAPEFLVDVRADSVTRYVGDTVNVEVRGRYLFGAPMRGGVVQWTSEVIQGHVPVPRNARSQGWISGDWAWWRGWQSNSPTRDLTGQDTLDANGRAVIRIPVAALTTTLSGIATINVAVTDANRQVVTSDASVSVSSSRVFILARPTGGVTTWRPGKPAAIELRVVDEHGMPARDATVRTVVVRDHWQEANPVTGAPAAQAIDTVRRDQLRLDAGSGTFTFTPAGAGIYAVSFVTADGRGGLTRTVVVRAVTDSAPKEMAVGYRLPLRTDNARLSVGDVARVRFDSPFRDAEAWITLEREGVLEQRRQRAVRGENVVDVRITERHAPNVFVSVILLARGDSVTRPDTATERLRAGYIELYVAHDRQRLSVALATDRERYTPRDTAGVRIRVRDDRGRGVRAEVALWAVDEGVLALTGYVTPDVARQVYTPRGVSGQLWSTVPTIITTNPSLSVAFLHRSALMLMASVGMSVSQVNSASAAEATQLRTRFSSTAFYLGAVETDDHGDAVARAALPDNLTTFRVMAVAASAGDQYGSGDTTLLVTRPLVARAALPRFVRPSDSLVAGMVITARDGRARPAAADVSATGLTVRGPARMSVSLSSAASIEARFVVTAPARDAIGDSVAVRLGASDGATADATETWLPVRPDYHRRSHAILGAVRDSQDVALVLPADIDPRRSRMRLRVGTSRLSAMLPAYRWLMAYRYDCTEQLSSVGRGIIAVWRATRRERPDALGSDPRAKLQELADEIARRQRSDGAFKYWPNWWWSSAWLTAYAGTFLLDARDMGVVIDPGVILRASAYLREASNQPVDTGGMNRYEQRARRLALGERVAAVEFLRRAGQPDTATERALLRAAPAMTWEDRLRLAEVVARRTDMRRAAESMVDVAWSAVTAAGHRVDLPDTARAVRAFPSRIAPAARLLSASIALRPTHPLLSGLVETVLQQGRAESAFAWNTQDYASVVMALAEFGDGDSRDRVVTARTAASTFSTRAPRTGVDTTISTPLVGMLETGTNGLQVLRVHVDATAGERPVYYSLEVDEVPLAPPVTPDIKGIMVERWYERFDNGAPVTRVNEGDLVRVRLRVTVPADREFVAVEDPLPAGLEPVDPSLRTSATLEAFTTPQSDRTRREGDRDRDGPLRQAFLYGRWDEGRWSPWEHKELHDDRVTYFARMLWTGSYTASYIARATTAGSFVAPPAYAEEMYNPALQGRSSGGRFAVDRLR